MLYFSVKHWFVTKKPPHFHCFDIGIYDKKEKAIDAINHLKIQEGFRIRPNDFHMYSVIRLRKPKLLNKTFWTEGFTSYTYIR